MRFRFGVDGRPATVDVEHSGAGWLVSVGDRRWRADLRPSGSGWSLLLSEPGDDSAPGLSAAKAFDVRLAWPASDRAEVRVDGTSVDVTVARVTASRRPSGAAVVQGGGGIVKAPMSGRVAQVLVAAGDRVESRQGLVVIEAMKMENELRAPFGGRVRAVHVRPGDSVEASAVLVELDT